MSRSMRIRKLDALSTTLPLFPDLVFWHERAATEGNPCPLLESQIGLLHKPLDELAENGQAQRGFAAPRTIVFGDNWFHRGSPGYNPGAGLGTLNVPNFANILAAVPVFGRFGLRASGGSIRRFFAARGRRLMVIKLVPLATRGLDDRSDQSRCRYEANDARGDPQSRRQGEPSVMGFRPTVSLRFEVCGEMLLAARISCRFITLQHSIISLQSIAC
jgi:hypothetical protein